MKRKALLSAAVFVAMLILIPSCASIGNPSGGPRDEDPPRFTHSSPEQGALNFSGNKATLYFNELVNVKDAFNKVVVSPPGGSTPRVSSLGNRITIEFPDTLLPNTTYTVDFGDAIEDNNEGNKLENFLYTFSTGDVLDTLMISGMVLGAEDLEPQQGMLVGLHTNPADSAFRTLRFDRVAKTDEYGRFAIGGLAPGEYRVFALTDPDNDLKYSSPEENLAFLDFMVSPTSERIIVNDSIYDLKTGAVDTVLTRERTRFLPNNILLRSFNSGFKPQYIVTYERPDTTRINLQFNSRADVFPTITLQGEDNSWLPLDRWAITEKSATNDTISLWITDPAIIANDTVRLAVSYFRGDKPSEMFEHSDTLRILLKGKRVALTEDKKKKGKKETEEKIEVPSMQIKSLGGADIGRPLTLEMEAPLAELDPAKIRLEIKVDTVWEAVAMPALRQDTLTPRRYMLDVDWDYDTQYKLSADSAAVRSVYGLVNKDFNTEFKIKAQNEYSSLAVNLTGYNDTLPVFVDLLDSGGKIKRALPVVNGRILFDNLLPGKYYLRLVVDRNGDGKYTPGDYDEQRQPDYSYYYPKMVNLKQNWSQELTWDVFSTPVNEMKPYSLLKNKPKLKKGQKAPQVQEEE